MTRVLKMPTGKIYVLEVLNAEHHVVIKYDFGWLDDAYYRKRRRDSAYVDHAPNPAAVLALAQQENFVVPREVYLYLVGLWCVEAKNMEFGDTEIEQ